MSEEQVLQAKIAALSGRINLQRQKGDGLFESTTPLFNGYGRARSSWIPQRGSPYGISRGRGGRVVPPIHRNRSLVLNNGGTSSPATQGSCPEGANITAPTAQEPVSGQGAMWVSKCDRHMQLINSSVFDQISLQRKLSMEESSLKKKDKVLQEKSKLTKYFAQGTGNSAYHSGRVHELRIDGIPFQVVNGGSKLVRRANDSFLACPTPKQVIIGGVTFLRSKNGNLYRSGLVPTKKHSVTRKNEPCPRFTTTGTCAKGPHCIFVHDPNKVAICKEFLSKGTCPANDACDLSHEATPNRVPACVHFIRGNCTNDNCRYAHIRVNPGAPVCRAFATLGFCEKGVLCTERHIFECPDYANKGTCRNGRCRLPHVDRAGQIRKKSAAAMTSVANDNLGDVSSDEDSEANSDDIDSDVVAEDTYMFGSDEPHGYELSHQQDYVRF